MRCSTHSGRLIALALAALLVMRARDGRAEPSATLLSRAESSLAQRRWGPAEEDLRHAVRQGRLSAIETQTAWAELGVALAMRGHAVEAREAFLRAALISPKFDVPATTPSHARAAADAARQVATRLGRWQVTCDVPERARRDKPVPVEVNVELPRGRIAKRLKIVAEQFATNQRWEQIEEAAPTAYHFDIPLSVLKDSPYVVVHLSIIDKEENVIAELSKVVPLEDGAAPTPTPIPYETPVRPATRDRNPEPAAEAPKTNKTFELHGTVRTLAAAAHRAGNPASVLDGTSLSQGRVTAKLLASDSISFEAHVLQAFSFASFPATINDATTFGPVRYRSLGLENQWAGGDRSAAVLAVDRLAMKIALAGADITIGRQPINFSKAYFWSPIDIFLPFTPQTIDREYKPGVDAVRVDIPLGEASGLNFVGAAGSKLTFNPLTSQVNTSRRAFDFDAGSSAAYARAFTNVGGYDLSVQGGSVYGGYQGAVGVAGELATIGLRAEASYFHARNNDPVAIPVDAKGSLLLVHPIQDHARVVFGVERRFENSLYLSAEYFYDGEAPGNSDYLTPAIQVALGETPNFSRHLVGGVVTYELIPTLVARFSAILGVASQASALITPSLDWSAAENADLQLGALIAVGQAPTVTKTVPITNSEFGSAPSLFYLQFKMYF